MYSWSHFLSLAASSLFVSLVLANEISDSTSCEEWKQKLEADLMKKICDDKSDCKEKCIFAMINTSSKAWEPIESCFPVDFEMTRPYLEKEFNYTCSKNSMEELTEEDIECMKCMEDKEEKFSETLLYMMKTEPKMRKLWIPVVEACINESLISEYKDCRSRTRK